MKRQIGSAALFVIILSLALSACGSKPTVTEAPVDTQAPVETVEQAPADTPAMDETQPAALPTASGSNPYPGPMVKFVPYNPYPAPVQGDTIEWSDVEALLASGEVAEVYQAFSLQITITMKDGSTVVVQAPAKNEIFTLLDKCGNSCSEIERISEYF